MIINLSFGTTIFFKLWSFSVHHQHPVMPYMLYERHREFIVACTNNSLLCTKEKYVYPQLIHMLSYVVFQSSYYYFLAENGTGRKETNVVFMLHGLIVSSMSQSQPCGLSKHVLMLAWMILSNTPSLPVYKAYLIFFIFPIYRAHLHLLLRFQCALNLCMQELKRNSPMHVMLLLIQWPSMHALQLIPINASIQFGQFCKVRDTFLHSSFALINEISDLSPINRKGGSNVLFRKRHLN